MQEAGKKFDSEKCMIQLVEPEFIFGTAWVMTDGARKYGVNNWKNFTVEDKPRFVGAMLRHLLAYAGGEIFDPESGRSHLYHLTAEAMFADHFDRLSGVVPSNIHPPKRIFGDLKPIGTVPKPKLTATDALVADLELESFAKIYANEAKHENCKAGGGFVDYDPNCKDCRRIIDEEKQAQEYDICKKEDCACFGFSCSGCEKQGHYIPFLKGYVSKKIDGADA